MRKNTKKVDIIFFLILEDSLPKSYFIFEKLFKETGHILAPVKIDQLQTLVSSCEQEQILVISSVTNFLEFKTYQEKVRSLLKYILKSKRLTFMHLSSFSILNDYKTYFHQKNYFFIKYPINAREITARIISFHELKQDQRTVWPGGKRSASLQEIV
jgi:hypothetical protein